MSEEKANSVNNQDVAIPEAQSKDTSQVVDQVQKTHENQEQVEGSKEYNFARLREKADKADQKNKELEKKILELREAFDRKNEPPQKVEEDELSKLSPDDILTVEQASKLSKREATKIVQEILEKQRVELLPDKARSQFNDFDTIMTEENINKLETIEPGLAIACSKAPNPWEATYKILKKFILPQQDMKATKGEDKIKENLSKPASSNSVSRQGPLSNANLWSEASKDELYKEMMQSVNSAR